MIFHDVNLKNYDECVYTEYGMTAVRFIFKQEEESFYEIVKKSKIKPYFIRYRNLKNCYFIVEFVFDEDYFEKNYYKIEKFIEKNSARGMTSKENTLKCNLIFYIS